MHPQPLKPRLGVHPPSTPGPLSLLTIEERQPFSYVVIEYDDIAEWYRELYCVEPVMADPFFPAVQELIGDVTGQQVCDLACGEGRVSRHLADRGARVIGIDLSGRLLAMAAQREQARPPCVAYVRDDAQGLAACGTPSSTESSATWP